MNSKNRCWAWRAGAFLCLLLPGPALIAQDSLDRVDPSVIQQELEDPDRASAQRRDHPLLEYEIIDPELDESILVGAVRVEGATELPASAFAPVVDSYVGRLLSPNELQKLASDIANVARAAGYGLATAWIPPQAITHNILKVMLDEGRIDKVVAEGEAAGIVERFLKRLANGRPVKTKDLERQLLLAGDVPGVHVGKARLDRDPAGNTLRVRTSRDNVAAKVGLDNWGSAAVGPVRAHLAADLNGLAADDDRLTIGGVLTPLDPHEFGLVRANYEKGVGNRGTVVNIGGYYARSQPGDDLAARDIDGTSIEASVGVSHPVVRSRTFSLWADLDLAMRDSEQSRQGLRTRDDRFTTLTASSFANRKMGNGRARARLAIVQGLPLFGATDEGDPLASRRDGSAVFTRLEAWLSYTKPVAPRLSVQLEAEGQVSSRALLASEEMGLGGRSFLRGYDYRELSGDNGIAASAELRWDVLTDPGFLKQVQLYTFADAGAVDNYGTASGGSLASAGGGIRLWIDKAFELGLELGLPLAERSGAGERDPRVSVTFGSRF